MVSHLHLTEITALIPTPGSSRFGCSENIREGFLQEGAPADMELGRARDGRTRLLSDHLCSGLGGGGQECEQLLTFGPRLVTDSLNHHGHSAGVT